METLKCPICQRALDKSANEHHLVPKTFGGKNTITLHKICHSKIHHTFTERDLKNYYYTVERIMENEDMQKFAKWVAKKPIDFYDGNKDTKTRKNKRRR
jgi:hypothetical protein